MGTEARGRRPGGALATKGLFHLPSGVALILCGDPMPHRCTQNKARRGELTHCPARNTEDQEARDGVTASGEGRQLARCLPGAPGSSACVIVTLGPGTLNTQRRPSVRGMGPAADLVRSSKDSGGRARA